MPRIDAHQHFWNFDATVDQWITDDMEMIRRDFLSEELFGVLKKNNIEGCIAVQAHESEAENDFLLGLVDQHSFIKAVVGWLDFMDPQLGKRLEYYKQIKVMKGFRYMLQGYKDRALMLHPVFQENIGLLESYHFTYDLLIQPDQLPYALKLAQNFPNQPFVVDHIAKPDIKNLSSANWFKDMTALASMPNVYCKLSGMITEADHLDWTREDIFPFIDKMVDAFGAKRLMYGSDWPVCLLAGQYESTIALVEGYFQHFSADEQADIMGGNALRFYNIEA